MVKRKRVVLDRQPKLEKLYDPAIQPETELGFLFSKIVKKMNEVVERVNDINQRVETIEHLFGSGDK